MEHYEEQGKSVVFCSLTNLVDTNWYVDFKFTLRRQSRVVVVRVSPEDKLQLQLWSRTGTNGGNSFSQLYLRSKGMHVKASRSIRSSIQYTVFCFSTCTDKDFLNFHSFFFCSKVHVVYLEITDTQLLSNPANNSDMTFGIFFFSTPAVERKG